MVNMMICSGAFEEEKDIYWREYICMARGTLQNSKNILSAIIFYLYLKKNHLCCKK